MRTLRPQLLAPLAVALALSLAACDSAQDPLPVGSFEVEVTGDVSGSATGTALLAEPDSSLNAGAMEWVSRLPLMFEATSGDSVQVYFAVVETRNPNGSFTELPEGTFPIVSGVSDRTRPVPVLSVRALRRDGVRSTVGVSSGTATLRRRPDGTVEGTVRARYNDPRLGGPTLRGSIDLRFTAPPR